MKLITQPLDKLSARFPRFASFRNWCAIRRRRLKVAFVLVMHVLGVLCSVQAVMSTRTPQGAIAWAISLNTIPYVAVPSYFIFGRSSFDGYDMLRHSELLAAAQTATEAAQILQAEGMLIEPQTEEHKRRQRLLESLAQLPITRFNDADLLIDGQATFDAILNSIANAEDYILVQFYIMRPDGLGNQLKDALCKKASEGVRVYMMYDGLGSRGLTEQYLQQLNQAGVVTASFSTTKGLRHRLRLNFRNHRKIVVVDGKEAFVGGHNVGDEYLGKHPTLTPWRDTHVAVRGPVALEAQVSFAEDWSWITGDVPKLNWKPEKAPQGNALALCLPTGPADEFETCTLLMLDLINSAKQSIWIATPYFVPDDQLVSALQLAALRGVEVKVLIPENNDDRLVDLTSYSYLEETEKAGIQIYRYQPGFMHQKVALIDRKIAAIGTANFDNRSMRLNFEVTMLLEEPAFSQQVEQMLLTDFAQGQLVESTEYTDQSLPFRFFVRVARLLAPVQ